MSRLIITESISEFSCSINESLYSIIEKITNQSGLPLIVIGNKGNLKGVISNGDILRHVKSKSFSSELKASDLMNRFPVYIYDGSPRETIEKILGDKVRIVPIINDLNIVQKIGYVGPKNFKINGKDINEDNDEIYLIAEIGVNHCGDEKIAKDLIREASLAGFDAVKFQFRGNDLLDNRSESNFDLASQYIRDELNRVELNELTENKLVEYAKSQNLDVIITPFTLEALKRAKKLNIDGIKIASCDLTNLPLIKDAANLGLPIILSTGMSYEHEILEANELVKNHNSNAVFLHCNSTYPAPPEDLNLSYLKRLEKITQNLVGYSSHDGIQQYCYGSVGCGSKIIEVHITKSRDYEGTDHKASLECKELKEFVKTCRKLTLANGSDKPRTPSQGELANRNVLSKSLTYNFNLKKGHILQTTDISLRSPGDGIQYSEIKKLIGKCLHKDVMQFNQILFEDIGIEEIFMNRNSISKFNFPCKNWGIPVRYRDINTLFKYFNPPLLEFHMSDKDILLNPSKYLPKKLHSKLVVHAIEQYSDGFILDLCSLNEEIRIESVKRLKTLLEHCFKLHEYFPESNKLKLILNIGGFTSYEFADKLKINEMFLQLNKSVEEIGEHKEIEFLPQTMPPFPWHQGGRSFHNICTSVESLEKVTDIFNSKYCLDISHTFLWCNYAQYSFDKFIERTKHLISHLHIADAHDHAEEGLDVGKGSINFKNLIPILENNSFTWIVETWQGHLNQGRGFASSLEELSDMMNIGGINN